MSKTVYISIDVETDGPIPSVYSMLSLGAAAYVQDPQDEWRQPGTFKRNLLPLPGAIQDPDTMAWWKTQPEAWKAATEDAVDAEQAMRDFVKWLAQIKSGTQAKHLVVVGYPVTFDFMFVYWYTVRFTGFPAPFGFQGADIKTTAWNRMGGEFRHATKKNMPKRWFRNCPQHTHDALDDARGQGILFMNILNDKEET